MHDNKYIITYLPGILIFTADIVNRYFNRIIIIFNVTIVITFR